MRSLLLAGIILAFAYVLAPQVYAAKTRVRKPAAGSTKNTVAYSGVKLSRSTNSINLSLLNIDKVTQLKYVLSYSSNNIPQGVVGTIATASRSADSRSLYFGTCSKGVCTPHSNIKNASLTVSATLKNGVTYTKRYLIKM